jgi:hypothetical protein
MKKLPIGPLTPKMNSKKNPTTVGGNTRGSVKTPSRKIFIGSFLILTIAHAANNPTKKVIKIDRLAVFIEIRIVEKSIMSTYPAIILVNLMSFQDIYNFSCRFLKKKK